MEHHHAAAVVAAAVVAVAATGMRTEEEPGAEDHGDDEDGAGRDTHPGERLQQTTRLVLGRRGGNGRCCWRGYRLRRGVGRGRCFSHD
ncbi:hypothetical protein, partial [Streptomyces edwardsiae]